MFFIMTNDNIESTKTRNEIDLNNRVIVEIDVEQLARMGVKSRESLVGPIFLTKYDVKQAYERCANESRKSSAFSMQVSRHITEEVDRRNNAKLATEKPTLRKRLRYLFTGTL